MVLNLRQRQKQLERRRAKAKKRRELYVGRRPESAAPSARAILHSAVADALGLGPRADYDWAREMLGAIGASHCDAELALGCDGKPLSMPGPHGTPSGARGSSRSSRSAAARADYDFMIPMPEGEFAAAAPRRRVLP